MGWTTGSGLGVAGEGRVEPVKVQQFDERVGLGAAKGREAGKWSGPAGWQERKKDMVSVS
jgi:RNA-binding protein 5/10